MSSFFQQIFCLAFAWTIAGAITVSCGEAAYQPSVAITWNSVILQAIRTAKPGPPQCARELAVFSTCMFDAWAAYDHVAHGTQYGDALRRPFLERFSITRRNEAVSFAAYRALVDLFPLQKAQFDVVMAGLGYNPADTSLDPSTAVGIGNLTAAAVLSYRHHDGSNQLGDLTASGVPYADYTGYAAVNPALVVAAPSALSLFVVPGRWQPLSYFNPDLGTVVTPKFIASFWGQVRPFALSDGTQFRPVPPAAWDSQTMRDQVDEVITISAGLDDRQKAIAEYWADGPKSESPPGHWNLIAQTVAARDHHTLGMDIKMFFALNNALLDASIATWEAKRFYDYWRPVSAIRYLKNGQTIVAWGGAGLGAQSMLGETWRPFQKDSFPTPPFSEYTSGHSAFSAAGAEVLRKFTGSNKFDGSMTIAAHSLIAEPLAPAVPVTLNWSTFTVAADEAGMSRRYGGIHFREGDLAGRTLGKQIGVMVYSHARSYWIGTRHDGDHDWHFIPRANN